jgi:hypothetical protein
MCLWCAGARSSSAEQLSARTSKSLLKCDAAAGTPEHAFGQMYMHETVTREADVCHGLGCACVQGQPFGELHGPRHAPVQSLC